MNCRFDVDICGDGINSFQVGFDGQLDKANAVKSFLDPQIRSAKDHDFKATYTLTFPSALLTTADQTEVFTKSLTRYGSGEAYVEAHAAAQEAKP